MLSSDLVNRFTHPGPEFGPVPTWWWTGDSVTAERIRWQMQRFKEGGIDNLLIMNLAPQGPQFGTTTDTPMWFSGEWWERFIEACDMAAQINMRIWFYDQIGFAASNFTAELRRTHPWCAGKRIVSAWLAETSPETLNARAFLGGFDLKGGRYNLNTIHQSNTPDVRVVVKRDTSFDYLNAAACSLLFNRIHGEFDRRVPHYLGNVIAGSFQDELPAMNNWSDELPLRFRERHGYDLLDELPSLFQREGRQAAKVRADYYKVRSELAEEAFFRPLSDWHSKRGMLLGSDQASPARGGFPIEATQLYADYFRTHRWYSASGSDHNGDSKVHSSMANLYGHKRVWLEAFHSSGWGGTLEETYDWIIPFLRSGANLYNPHASYFSTFGGWFEWAPPSTDWRQPYWRQYPLFAKAIARICSVCTWGRPVSDVAVLHPCSVTQSLVPLDAPGMSLGEPPLDESFAEVNASQELYLALCGQNDWFNTRIGLLDAAQVIFDIVDDDSLQTARIESSRLVCDSMRFSTVILPSMPVLEERTAATLLSFLEAGGCVIAVGQLPRFAAGTAADDSVVLALTNHPKLRRVSDVTDIMRHISVAADIPRADVPLLIRQCDDQFIALVPGAFPSASLNRQIGSILHRSIEFDRNRYQRIRRIELSYPISEAEIWDPASGTRRPLNVERSATRSTLDVELNGAPAVMVAWKRGSRTEKGPSPQGEMKGLSPRLYQNLTEWSGELLPTTDNRWGDFAMPPSVATDKLQLWSLGWSRTRAAEGPWQHVRVTFGQQALTFGPCASHEAPPVCTTDDVARIVEGSGSLGTDKWVKTTYSSSRGIERDPGVLGNKAFVCEEFIRTDAPRTGEVVCVRALIGGVKSGRVDLVVGAGSEKHVWWNGVEVTAGDGYLFTATVDARAEGNVLEYRLGRTETIPTPFSALYGPPYLGSFYALAECGTFGGSPVLIGPRAPVRKLQPISFRRRFAVAAKPKSTRLILGTRGDAKVLLDGMEIARKSSSEWYADINASSPVFSAHDINPDFLGGSHSLEIILTAVDTTDALIADWAFIQHDGTVSAISTDDQWYVQNGDITEPVQVCRGGLAEMAWTRAARRSHPLPLADWLRGAPELGTTTLAIESTVVTEAAAQFYRALLPAGTHRVDLPLRLRAICQVEGAQFSHESGAIKFPTPLQEPRYLTVEAQSNRFMQEGAAWSGPLIVHTRRAPIALGDWRDIGLGAWSGGVAYRTTVKPLDVPGRLILNLGDVRGSVEIFVDDIPAGSAFCAPFTFDIGERSAPFELKIVVFNTLAPFLFESTPTTCVLPGQLRSGLFGPVTLGYGLGSGQPTPL